MDTYPANIPLAFLHRRHSWFVTDAIHICSSEAGKKKIVRQMMLHLLADKSVLITLTSKTCYPLGSIATQLAL